MSAAADLASQTAAAHLASRTGVKWTEVRDGITGSMDCDMTNVVGWRISDMSMRDVLMRCGLLIETKHCNGSKTTRLIFKNVIADVKMVQHHESRLNLVVMTCKTGMEGGHDLRAAALEHTYTFTEEGCALKFMTTVMSYLS
jgi:hypothetical protein